MFIDLVDSLRCVEPHTDTYLVAAPLEMADRHIVRGTLGCPICGAEYHVRDGVTFFSTEDARPDRPPEAPTEYEALRAAALLDLEGNNGFAMLAGAWGAVAPAMLDSVAVPLVLINPPRAVKSAAGLSIVVADGFPVVPARARGIAVDQATVSRTGIVKCAAMARSGGRLVAPADCELPSNVRLLASDDRHWVAEVSHATLTTISRKQP